MSYEYTDESSRHRRAEQSSELTSRSHRNERHTDRTDGGDIDNTHETRPYDDEAWTNEPIESLALPEETHVRLTWQSPYQPHPSSVEGTVIEPGSEDDPVRIETPSREGELRLYRSSKHDDYAVVATTISGTVELGTLHSIDVIERPGQPDDGPGFYPAILEWRDA